jgi:hypothetical protein
MDQAEIAKCASTLTVHNSHEEPRAQWRDHWGQMLKALGLDPDAVLYKKMQGLPKRVGRVVTHGQWVQSVEHYWRHWPPAGGYGG